MHIYQSNALLVGAIALVSSLTTSVKVVAISAPSTHLATTPRRVPYLSTRRAIINVNNGQQDDIGYDIGSKYHPNVLNLRGGADEIVGAPAKFDLELTPAKVLTYTGAALLAAFTIVLVKKVPRSGGRAPAPIAEFLTNIGMSELGATGLFHLAYFIHCFVVIAIMPQGLKETVFSPAGVILLGTVFPVVESIKAASRPTDDGGSNTQSWLMYWVMHGCFSFASHDMGKMVKRFGPRGGKHWYEFQFYMVLWLILPFTDGAAILYEFVTKPYIVPIVAPIAKAAEGWLTTVALTLINASHLWFVVFFFMALPTVLKRFAVIATGTVYPVAATIVAVATDNDGIADDKWLTYWSCFSLLYLGMISAERFVGKVPGLYTLCLAVTLYLMLPIFEGSDAVFRTILVPLFRQRESLLLKDAKKLAKDMVRQLPVDRHSEAGKAAAAAFLEEANKKMAEANENAGKAGGEFGGTAASGSG